MKRHILIACSRPILLMGMLTITAKTSQAAHWCDTDPQSVECVNEKIVSSLYLRYLERPADAAADYWTISLNSGALTRDALEKILFRTQEACTVRVAHLYRTVLMREPEEAGLTAWTAGCVNGLDTYEMQKAFETSPEYLSNFSVIPYRIVHKGYLSYYKDVGFVVDQLGNPHQTYVPVSIEPGQVKEGQLTMPSLTDYYYVSVGFAGRPCTPSLITVPAVTISFPNKSISVEIYPLDDHYNTCKVSIE